MNDEKLELDEIEDDKLSRASDPIEEKMKNEKSKKKSMFGFLQGKDKKELTYYVGGAALVIVAVFMLNDGGAETVDKQAIAKNIQKSGDIYSTKSQKDVKNNSLTEQEKIHQKLREKRLEEMRREAAKNRVGMPSDTISGMATLKKDKEKRKKEKKEKDVKEKITNKEKSSVVQSHANDKGFTRNVEQKNEKNVIVRKKKVQKRELFNRKESYFIDKSEMRELRCFSVKDSNKLFKIENGLIVAYKYKTNHKKRLDGKMIKASKNNDVFTFVSIGKGNAVMVSEDSVFCDMDSWSK